jgi:hypothetical protein
MWEELAYNSICCRFVNMNAGTQARVILCKVGR